MLLTRRPTYCEQDGLWCGRRAAEPCLVSTLLHVITYRAQIMAIRTVLQLTVSIACVSQFVATDCAAQVARDLAPGTHVRLETSNSTLVTGVVAALRRDSVSLRIDKSDVTETYAVSSLRAFSRSLGADRWRGARRGALLSGGIGLLATALVLREDLKPSDSYIRGTLFVAPAAILFTLLGTGVGALSAPEQWSRVQRLSVGAQADSPGRLALAYRITF